MPVLGWYPNVPFKDSTDQMTEQPIMNWSKRPGKLDDLAVMVAGSPPGVPGSTNMLKVTAWGYDREIDPALSNRRSTGSPPLGCCVRLVTGNIGT